MRLFRCLCYVRPMIVGPILLVWALSQGGCQVPNPNYCPPEYWPCTDAGPPDAGPIDAVVPIDAATDAATDGPPLVAAILACNRVVGPAPDDGIAVGWPVQIRCDALARQCNGVATPTNLAFPVIPFALGPLGQPNQWQGKFLPALGGNTVKVTCEGDVGTAPAERVFADPLYAMKFDVLVNAGGVPTPATWNPQGWYEVSAGDSIYLDWEAPGVGACESSGDWPAGPRPGMARVGPFLAGNNPVTRTYTISCSLYRASVVVKVGGG